MFGYFNSGPHTWKFAVPAAIFIVLIPVTGKMFASPNSETQFWSMIPCGFGFLFLAIAAVNLWKLLTAHAEELFTQHQEALSLTPIVLLSQNMKQMHPEAVKVLNRFGARTSWQVRVNANNGTRDWVLADTNVHFGFIEFVLSRSGVGLYPKRNFSQGSKKWDPDGLVEDREQYDEFETWMFSRLMVTRPHGEFHPAEFIPPWRPELILETMGLTGEQDLYRPDEDLKLKNIGSDQKPVISQQPVKEEHEVRMPTDDEMDAIRIENERYEKLLKGNGADHGLSTVH